MKIDYETEYLQILLKKRVTIVFETKLYNILTKFWILNDELYITDTFFN